MSKITLATCVVSLSSLVCLAAVPQKVNHQGVVSVNTQRFNGTGTFRFAIVDPDAGVNLWTNDGTNQGVSGLPTAGVALDVTNGVYSVGLGDTIHANMTAIPNAVFDDSNATLRIWFDDGVNGNQQLTPDHALMSAPYSYRLPEVHVDTSGNVGIGTSAPAEKLDVDGNIVASGTITQGSSRSLKYDILALSAERALEALRNLVPVTFHYIADRNPSNTHVGFIAEDVPDLLATPDRRGLSAMDVGAVLTKVVQFQDQQLAEKDLQLKALQRKVDDLAGRLGELEAQRSRSQSP